MVYFYCNYNNCVSIIWCKINEKEEILMSRLYILIRNDIPSLNPGKAVAQASHAVSQFMTKFPKESKKWCVEADGFGTTVVMEGTKDDIKAFMKKYPGKIPSGNIIDPSYPFYLQKEIIPYLVKDAGFEYAESSDNRYDTVPATRKEYTCSWFFIEDDDREATMEDLRDELDFYKIKLFR
jgi:hypothetical protein